MEEDGAVTPTSVGTPQGAVISPLLANIYLHYVFDLWAQQWRGRHAHGNVIIVRYADDIVAGFEHEADARRFLADTDRIERGLIGGSRRATRRFACPFSRQSFLQQSRLMQKLLNTVRFWVRSSTLAISQPNARLCRSQIHINQWRLWIVRKKRVQRQSCSTQVEWRAVWLPT
jgi:hypothetical protein